MARIGKYLLRRGWNIFRRLFLYLFVAQLGYLIALKWVNPPCTWTTLTNRIGAMGSPEHFRRTWVSYDEISPDAKLAVIAGEDQLFPEHNGFDIKSIKKAWAHNQYGKRIRGASTISQQTAKNVFLWQGRSWFRKGLEVYFTFMIEKIWGKRRILEIYLNLAQMGPHLFGMEAAATRYFGRHAKDLNRSQAALIVACLPNPVAYRVKPPSRYMLRRQQWIITQMGHLEGDPDIKALITGH